MKENRRREWVKRTEGENGRRERKERTEGENGRSSGDRYDKV